MRDRSEVSKTIRISRVTYDKIFDMGVNWNTSFNDIISELVNKADSKKEVRPLKIKTSMGEPLPTNKFQRNNHHPKQRRIIVNG
jgi:hypothetical protein